MPQPPAAVSATPATRTGGNYNIFNGGKIRIDLTNTKYKVLRECALEMKWKVITAKKRNDADNQGTAADNKGSKKDSSNKNNDLSVAE